MAQVHWHRMSAQQVYDQYRALYSYRRLMTGWHGEPVRIVELTLPPNACGAVCAVAPPPPPGTVEYCRVAKQLRVWCADGRWVGVRRLSVVGKRTFTAADFNNGYLRRTDADRRPPVFA